jgi:hypothetical protein
MLAAHLEEAALQLKAAHPGQADIELSAEE